MMVAAPNAEEKAPPKRAKLDTRWSNLATLRAYRDCSAGITLPVIKVSASAVRSSGSLLLRANAQRWSLRGM